MPDPTVIVTAMIIALVISVLMTGVIGWFNQPGWTGLNKAGCILGIGFGFFIGCWVLGVQPRLRPREDLERLLVVVLPAVTVIELLTMLVQLPAWLVWSLRLTLLAGMARVLLHGTSYITDLTGPGTREWSPLLTWLIFGGWTMAGGAAWALLSPLTSRVSDSSLSICLAMTSAGAALTVMLSGYATGGQIGFPLAAALVGTMVTTLIQRRATRGIAPIGFVFVSLFSVLLVGHFFGALSLAHAVLLLCAPLFAWIPELPHLRHLPSWLRDSVRMALVLAMVILVMVRAQTKFNHDFPKSSVRASQTHWIDPVQIAQG